MKYRLILVVRVIQPLCSKPYLIDTLAKMVLLVLCQGFVFTHMSSFYHCSIRGSHAADLHSTFQCGQLPPGLSCCAFSGLRVTH